MTTPEVCHIPNIGERGRRRRRVGGYVWLAIALALAASFLMRGVAPAVYALLALPFTMWALGVLQAREKT